MVSPPVDAFFLCWMVVTLLCCDQVYATLFTLEAFMQLVSGGCRAYIWGPSWAWNWLDIFVVSSSWGINQPLEQQLPSDEAGLSWCDEMVATEMGPSDCIHL